MSRTWLLQGRTVFHHDHSVHLSKFHSARPDKCTELLIYWSCDQIPMVLKAPSVIARGFPRNHQNGRTHSTTTHTAREIVSAFRTGRKFTSVVFCSVHKGVTWGVLGSEVRIRRKTNKFSGCSCMVIPWPISIHWMSQKDMGEHACEHTHTHKYTHIHTHKSRAKWEIER